MEISKEELRSLVGMLDLPSHEFKRGVTAIEDEENFLMFDGNSMIYTDSDVEEWNQGLSEQDQDQLVDSEDATTVIFFGDRKWVNALINYILQ